MGYGVAILKPDSVRDGLELEILQCLSEGGLEIVWCAYWNISPNITHTIYPSEVSKSTYLSTVHALTFGPAMLVIVKTLTEADVWDVLRQLKGKMDTGGIRHRFCFKNKGQLIVEGLTGRDLQDRLAENRLHTPDSMDEALDILRLYQQHEVMSVPEKVLAILFEGRSLEGGD